MVSIGKRMVYTSGRALMVSGLTLGLLGAVEAQALSSTATGYMVEVHTCAKEDSGTDSTIRMRLNIRDPNWTARQLGPWTQDHVYPVNGREYNDHERNQWDQYFFPESTPTAHIEALILDSDGKGNKPGWCWDRHYVTRIENGRSVWTWAWENESPWIYGGTTSYQFTYGTTGRPIPRDLREATGTGDQPLPVYGSIRASTFYDGPSAVQYGCGDDVVFQLRSTRQQIRVMPMVSGYVGPGLVRCEASTLFDRVVPGGQTVDRMTTDGRYVIDCKTVNVAAGQRSEAAISFLRGCPQ
jgi:hypothetical protein